ncbi:MAG: nitrilase-related carbon-nitrogen hydrolase, partial [Draconibacterium sp.]
MEDLKITIVQPDIIWEDTAANLEKYSRLLKGDVQTDLIVLPEMFTTGFSMNPQKLQEPMDGPTINWMKKLAAEKEASVLGSVIIGEQGLTYNRAVWVFPDGNLMSYDKRHLYTMGKEHLHYATGRSKTIVEYKGWKFCPLICYDLRFPVWA